MLRACSVALIITLGSGLSPLSANDHLHPTYPSIPPDYEVLYPHSLVSSARVDFPAYYIDHTNGYRVTTPSGTEFVVNSITQPKCAFYANYVSTDDSGYLGVNNKVAVNNQVYIGEVNFEKCQ
jgi:hypothetical protein